MLQRHSLNQYVGIKIKEFRKERGWTPHELFLQALAIGELRSRPKRGEGTATNQGASMIRKYELGNRFVAAADLAILALALDRGIKEFFPDLSALRRRRRRADRKREAPKG